MEIRPPESNPLNEIWRILIVDDDEDDYILVRDMLKEAKGRKFDIHWAATYEEGQTKLAEDRYDAVFVDNDLGARTGIELIRTLNEQSFTTPLILFTGRGSYEVDIEAMRAGATVYLSKNELSALSLERFIRYAIERKQAETALKEQEQRIAAEREWFRTILTSIGDAVITCDPQGNVTFLNPVAEGLTGWKSGEAAGKPLGIVFQIINEQTHLPAENPVEKVIQTGSIIGLANHTALVSRSGEKFAIEDSAAPINDANGQIIGVVMVFHDVTERRKAAEQVGYQASLLAQVQDAVVATDEQWRGTYWNRMAEEIFGWSKEEANGKILPDLFRSEFPQATRDQVHRQLMDDGHWEGEVLYHRKDGTIFSAQVRTAKIIGPQGEPIGYVSSVRDITKSKQAEEALKKSKADLSIQARLIELSYEPIMIWDLQEGIQSWNTGCEQLYGYSRTEAVGQVTHDLLHTQHPVDLEIFLSQLRINRRWTGELRHQTKDGREVVVESRQELVEIDGKQLVLETNHDISERKRAELSLRQSEAELRQNEAELRESEAILRQSEAELRKYSEALRESEERFRVLFHNRHSPMLLIDPATGQIIEANPAACVYYGWSQEEMTRMKISDINTLPADQTWQEMQKAEAAVTSMQFTFRHQIASGEVRDVEVNSGPIQIGQKEYLFSIIRDITERKLAEEALLQSEERERNRAHELAAILDAVPAYILITHDPDSRYMTGNRATNELMQTRPGDNISMTAPEYPPKIRAMRDGKELSNEEMPVQLAAARCIHVEDYEFDIVFEDGSSRRLMGNAAPLCDEHGNTAGAVGAFIDITELRRMERETSERTAVLEVQRRLLEHREMERSQIARDLHDGPIQSLGGLSFSLQMLQSSVENQEARAVIEQMKQDVRDLAGELRGVCNELRPPLLERFGFRKAVQAHVDGFRERHPEIRLDLDMTENPEKLPENIATALFRIYQEALNNIVRHSQATEISILFNFDPQQVHLEIQDNGKGLPEKIDWVELVHQGHFGLVGMKERAEAIGGEFKAYSSPEEGTTIQVTVPIIQ